MIVLDEFDINASGIQESPLVVSLQKKSSRIAVYHRLQDKHVGDCGTHDLQSKTLSDSTRRRYSPYPLFANGLAKASSWLALMYPLRYAISSRHAIFNPCRRSIVSINCEASSSES